MHISASASYPDYDNNRNTLITFMVTQNSDGCNCTDDAELDPICFISDETGFERIQSNGCSNQHYT